MLACTRFWGVVLGGRYGAHSAGRYGAHSAGPNTERDCTGYISIKISVY